MISQLEYIQDLINDKFARFIALKSATEIPSSQILEKCPDLVAVHHGEYDRKDYDARFRFGRFSRAELPELLDEYYACENSWDEREPNAIQKSLKKQTLFSKITVSFLNKIRGFIKKDKVEEKGDETQEK